MILLVAISAVVIHLIFKVPFITAIALIGLGYFIGISTKKGK